MRVLDGEQTLVRIFVGEGDQWRHRPLATALLERLRAEGFAGATVMRGVAGFGANSVIHTSNLVDLSGDLPVLDRGGRRRGAHRHSSWPSSTRWSEAGRSSPWRGCAFSATPRPPGGTESPGENAAGTASRSYKERSGRRAEPVTRRPFKPNGPSICTGCPTSETMASVLLLLSDAHESLSLRPRLPHRNARHVSHPHSVLVA
jgi:hypothetical protein